MTSKIKVDNITNQSDSNIVNKCGTTITLGASGDTISLASGASQTGFGRTGTVDWDTTPKTATFSAVSGNGYFCNTSGGAFTVNLPAGSAGAIVSLADYAATWQTNNLTVSPNGTEKIGSINADATLSTEGQSVTFVYVDSTQGWINTMDSTSNVRASAFICASVSGACNTLVTVDTDYKVATFLGPGTFTVNSGGGALAVVDYLVVAGGGGGGSSTGDTVAAGGAGAGGYRESKVTATSGCWSASPLAATTSLPLSVQAYPIQVGAGGSGGTVPQGGATSGTPSIFTSIISTGGGRGSNSTSSTPGSSGGSGGGGSWNRYTAGSGNTPPVSPPQGNNGGAPGSPTIQSGGGGGGALAVGQNNNGQNGGAGGAGVSSSISGSATSRGGGGGGGGGYPGCNTGGAGGNGGGGAGGNVVELPNHPGTAGTVNRGGGGGGGGGESNNSGPLSNSTGGAGGSGIVIIRYKFQ
jgi:hypothetical protein